MALCPRGTDGSGLQAGAWAAGGQTARAPPSPFKPTSPLDQASVTEKLGPAPCRLLTVGGGWAGSLDPCPAGLPPTTGAFQSHACLVSPGPLYPRVSCARPGLGMSPHMATSNLVESTPEMALLLMLLSSPTPTTLAQGP